jgi:hypothetical protein
MTEIDAESTPSNDLPDLMERLRHVLLDQGAHPKFLFDDSLHDHSPPLLDQHWHTLFGHMFDVLFRRRAVDIKDNELRGKLLFALYVWHDVNRVVLEALDAAEAQQRAKDDESLRDGLGEVATRALDALSAVSKAVKGISPEREARMGFLESLVDARAAPLGPLKFGPYSDQPEALDDSEVARLGPERVAELGYFKLSQGWWARRYFMAWPSYGHRLTLDDYEDAVRIMAQDDNSTKWSVLAEYLAKAGLGTISPASLAADWRKWRVIRPAPGWVDDERPSHVP